MMNLIWLYTVTPLLGLLRNYIKYKQCKCKTFLRTPLVYSFFHFYFTLLGYKNVIWRSLIFERWFFFIEKSCISLWKNDYINNKDKYIVKYKLNYM